jgi:hypothetical protein
MKCNGLNGLAENNKKPPVPERLAGVCEECLVILKIRT